MKAYSIGRDVACNIVINDSTDVISRRHAVLNVSTWGKMTITDQSHNGTYVNGIRISSNVPVPVTRKDNVSFAHVARLDWNRIPDTRGTIIKFAIAAVVVLFLVVGGIVGFLIWGLNGCSSDNNTDNTPAVVVTDSVKKDTTDKAKPAPTDTVKPKKETPKPKTDGKKDNGKKDNKPGKNDTKPAPAKKDSIRNRPF